jgi:hypothetical protein
MRLQHELLRLRAGLPHGSVAKSSAPVEQCGDVLQVRSPRANTPELICLRSSSVRASMLIRTGAALGDLVNRQLASQTIP